MVKKHWTSLAAVGAAAVLALTGCAQGTPGGGDDEGIDASDTPWEVASDVDIDSATLTAAQERGSIRIGVKEDQPGLGYLDPTTNERTGFDIDMARWMAASLGFAEDDIEFEAIPSANRESALSNGDIDLYVGTYSITDERKELVGFAGPYFVTGQGLLVAADNEEITGPESLDGQVVCSATGSTPIQNIRDNYPEAQTEEFDTYSQCVEALINGSVDAVTTDELILVGYAAQDSANLKVVGKPFSVENYGIGVPLEDTELRDYLDDVLEDGGDIWTEIYDANLGDSGVDATQPEVERY